jgi:hypothetical protein
MKAIRIEKTGGPEVMQLVDVDLPPPGPGEVRIRHTAIGLNFIDTYHRSGLYPVQLPSGLGLEAAGVVEETGEGVTHLKSGDRVAYGNGPIGAYAQARNMPANRVSKLPDEISDETAAAMMLKGMTVRYLLRETYKVAARRHHPAACRGGRRRPHRLPVGQGAGRHRHRHRGVRGEGRACPRPRLPTTSSSTRRRTCPPGCARSPAARRFRWSTTGSARTR